MALVMVLVLALARMLMILMLLLSLLVAALYTCAWLFSGYIRTQKRSEILFFL